MAKEQNKKRRLPEECAADKPTVYSIAPILWEPLPEAVFCSENPSLSLHQAAVLREVVVRGQNVFLTGPAGVGKSFLLRQLILSLRSKKKRVAVTASTGIAAEALGGSTLHAFAGCGIPSCPEDFLRCRRQSSKNRWCRTDVLVVDEISMISAELFDNLEATVRGIRSPNQKPFGGIQLVLCGDFFQLPPILKGFNRHQIFEGIAWKNCNLKCFQLTHSFRQLDLEFVDILNSIRIGKVTQKVVEFLKGCSRPLVAPEGISVTELHAHNIDVDKTNNRKFAELDTHIKTFFSEDSCKLYFLSDPSKTPRDRQEGLQLLKNHSFWKTCQAHSTVQLRKGAQVILLKNLDLESNQKLVNGSRGVVVDWVGSDIDKGTVFPLVRFQNGRTQLITPEDFSGEISFVGECVRTQLPLRLAWALSIHRCQGMTLDVVRLKIDKVFSPGQAYVAISRARALSGIEITNFNAKRITVDRKVLELYKIEETSQCNAVDTEVVDGPGTLSFGKHRGQTFAQVWESDRQYCIWAISQTTGGISEFSQYCRRRQEQGGKEKESSV